MKQKIKLEIKQATSEMLFINFLEHSDLCHERFRNPEDNSRVYAIGNRRTSFDFNEEGELIRIVHYNDDQTNPTTSAMEIL